MDLEVSGKAYVDVQKKDDKLVIWLTYFSDRPIGLLLSNKGPLQSFGYGSRP